MLLRRSLRCSPWGLNTTHLRLEHQWREPIGYVTDIKIYNEIAKRKVPLIFPDKNYVKWYMCGPTVYDVSHIGHACCYVKLDIIHRILKEYYDIHPVVAIGVTDMAEEITKKALLLNIPIWEITRKYTTEFFDQMNALNVLPSAFKLKVSNHISIIQNFVDLLIRRRAAYKGIDGTVYFNTEADLNYGRFRDPSTVENSISLAGKRNPRDFALWKAETGNKSGLSINSPWGKGFPGWHIECSAMASHVFGSTVDLHSGGTDLIFPHHENEEAQSTIYHNCDQWVNYWLHPGLINVGNVKMSKSLNNVITISEFLHHHKSDELRMFCFMSTYSTELNFEDTTIQLAVSVCQKVVNFLDLAESYISGSWDTGNVQESELLEELDKTQKIVKRHLANNFGTPEALKAVLHLIKKCSKMLSEKPTENSSRSPATIAVLIGFVRQFFQSFGFKFTEAVSKSGSISVMDTVVTSAVKIRAKVREFSLKVCKTEQHKNDLLALCDKFRNKLLNSGVVVNDLEPGRSHWSVNSFGMENKTMLKDLLDDIVWFRKEIQKIMKRMSFEQESVELLEISRYIEMYFATLGVTIQDGINGQSEWIFPNTELKISPLLGEVLQTSLQFHSQVRRTAECMQEKERREELLCLCDSVISELDERGVIIDEATKSFEIVDEKGMSILNIAVNIIVHFRDQTLVVTNLTNDIYLKNRLFKLSSRLKKNLTSYGFAVMESTSNVFTSWKMRYSAVHKSVLVNIIKITVILLNETMKLSKLTTDNVAKLVLLELCNSVIADLQTLGIVVSDVGRENLDWNFKLFESREFPVCCSPPQTTDSEDKQTLNKLTKCENILAELRFR